MIVVQNQKSCAEFFDTTLQFSYFLPFGPRGKFSLRNLTILVHFVSPKNQFFVCHACVFLENFIRTPDSNKVTTDYRYFSTTKESPLTSEYLLVMYFTIVFMEKLCVCIPGLNFGTIMWAFFSEFTFWRDHEE
ncbi:hypothetical protein DM02DRAFT_617818 [Periconia macrospinosa]|uniref:Uncharacterized protein n=1 Tax=Periconia macrospinosa TaxID=97972 RepID=A0A2V1DBW5_9PLEO|nr:hypothetical protein DM02DRAFT_617818 [Periconia macrospinosa]